MQPVYTRRSESARVLIMTEFAQRANYIGAPAGRALHESRGNFRCMRPDIFPKLLHPTHFVIEGVARRLYGTGHSGVITQGRIELERELRKRACLAPISWLLSPPIHRLDAAPAAASAIQIKDNSPQMGRLIASRAAGSWPPISLPPI